MRKAIHLTILLLSLIFSAVAPTRSSCQEAPQRTKVKTSIGLVFSIDRTYRSLGGDSRYGAYIDQLNDQDIPATGYIAGASLIFALSENVNMETGLNYALRGYQTKDLSVNVGTQDNPQYVMSSFRYKLQYLDIPLNFYYYLNQGKARFYLLAGLMHSSLLSAVVESSSSAITDKTIGKTLPFIVSVNIGAGFDWNFSPDAMLKIQPVYRQSLTSYTSGTFNIRPNSFGVAVGIYTNL